MKKKQVSLLLVLVMLFSSPLTALAATHDVSTSWEVEEVFWNDTDDEVVLNLTDDIDMESYDVYANEGQNYTFNTDGYELSNVSLYGDGKVVINGDIEGDYYHALTTGDSVRVTVKGNINAEDGEDGINANGSSVVTVFGDITAYEDAVEADSDSVVTVIGDIESISDDGIAADDDATVRVFGNIFALEDDGIETDENANVTVFGNIRAGEDGINASADEDGGNAVITVFGNVFGGLDLEADGIDAGSDAEVTVFGNVSGTDFGVEADENAVVNVQGQIIGGTDIYDNAVLNDLLAGGVSFDNIITGRGSYSGIERVALKSYDLDGKLWTNKDFYGRRGILMVFLDPAAANAAELVKAAQELKDAYGEKLLVLGVLLSDDEDGAKALNAGFPILHKTTDLLSFYDLDSSGMLALAAGGSCLGKSADAEVMKKVLEEHFA